MHSDNLSPSSVSPSRRWAKVMFFVVSAVGVSACGLFAARAEVAHDWVLTAVDGATLSVIVAVGSGSCDRFDRIDVTETVDEVTLTAVVVETDGGTGLFPGGCDDDLHFEFVDVTLDAPLGDRPIRGCAPGVDGLQDYFSDGRADNGGGPDDCSAVTDAW